MADYSAAYAQWGLPYCIHEYAADGTTELRRTYYDYNLSPEYVDRRIIGLVAEVHLTNVGSFQSKIVYGYDDPARLEAVPAAATQHDTTYNTSFTARGNVTSVSRWDVTDITNAAKKLTTYTSYYTTGTPISHTDPSKHTSSMLYADSFSDGTSRNTFAYPTSFKDADNYESTSKYNYDFGALTRTQDPKGAVHTITYDSATRVNQVTNEISGAYSRYAYAPVGSVATYSTIQEGAGDAYRITYFDGAGRVRVTAADHPGSSGGYAGMFVSYDVMGRVSEQTNPGELNASWVPTGDDAAGLPSTLQTYDWKGRPLLTTNPGGSTRENTYGGCGCAGGEQTTTRDERGRRSRFTRDVFGRLSKVEELNWDQSVYATTNYTYNVRDQIEEINQAGQLRNFTYDGYGRLQTRTTPEQGATNYTYYPNGMKKTVTDARGATTTFLYNKRDLVTSISYGVPSGVAPTPNVSFGYDSIGNRTSMNDGLGSVSYVYNTLSQLTSETRIFTGVTGSFALTYGYNLAGQLNSITNPWAAQVGYGYDKIGRPTNVSGVGYSGLTSYVNSLTYRAFGPKKTAYSNGRTLSVQYDNRMRPTQWNIPGVMGWNYSYQYFNENSGRLMYAQNINDGTLDRSYDYDHVGRLVASHSGAEARAHVGIGSSGVVDGPYSQRYSFDGWGNLTSRNGWGGDNANFTASYSNNKRIGLNYDLAGNLLFDGGQTFTYDASGQATTASFPGYRLEQFYDGDGLRVKKSDAGAVTLYLRSTVLGGQVVAEMSSTGAWQRGYVYLGSQLLAIQQSGVYWVHQDPLVKSKRVTNSSGNIVSTLELDPWGGNTSRNNSDVFQPHRFTNYERDLNASDEAMFRRYNRWWSRFDQPDPYGGSYELTNPQSFNRYAYVQNDPVNYVDPLGLDGEGSLGGPLGDVAGMGPGTSIVNVVIDGGFTGTIGDGGEVIMALAPQGRLGPIKPQDPGKPKPGTTIHEILTAPMTPEEQEKIRKAKIYADCFHKAMKGPNEELERLMYTELKNTVVFSLGGKRIFGAISLGRALSPLSSILLGAHFGFQHWAHELNEFDRKTYSPARKAADEKCRKEAGY